MDGQSLHAECFSMIRKFLQDLVRRFNSFLVPHASRRNIATQPVNKVLRFIRLKSDSTCRKKLREQEMTYSKKRDLEILVLLKEDSIVFSPSPQALSNTAFNAEVTKKQRWGLLRLIEADHGPGELR